MTPCSCRSTIILPATHVCLHVASYSAFAFPCALSGPFNKLRSAGFSAPRLSVSARFVFTSASSVYNYSLFACAYLSTGSVFRQYNLKIIFNSLRCCSNNTNAAPNMAARFLSINAAQKKPFPKEILISSISLPCIYMRKNACRLPLYETSFYRVQNLQHATAATSLLPHSYTLTSSPSNEQRRNIPFRLRLYVIRFKLSLSEKKVSP